LNKLRESRKVRHTSNGDRKRQPTAASWFVYILRCRDGTLYTGITVDLEKRLEAHGNRLGAKYTRSRLPAILVYEEAQPDRSSALKREAALRRLGRAGKLALIGEATSTTSGR
jgi:putative endonuclease